MKFEDIELSTAFLFFILLNLIQLYKKKALHN